MALAPAAIPAPCRGRAKGIALARLVETGLPGWSGKACFVSGVKFRSFWQPSTNCGWYSMTWWAINPCRAISVIACGLVSSDIMIGVYRSHSRVFPRSSSNLSLNRSGVFRPIAPHHEYCPQDDRQAHNDPHRSAACLG